MKRILLVAAAILIAATTTVSSQPQLDKAKDLLKQKKYDEAIAVCQIYLQSSTRNENGWLVLAKAYQQAQNLDSAEIAAKKAVQLDDEMMEGYTVLGQVQLAKKNAQDAYATAKQGLKMTRKKESRYPPLLVVLGQSLIALDSADAALVASAEAKELDPQNATAYEVMGDAYLKQKVTPMAISSYEKSLEIDSLQHGVLYKIANAHKNERQYTKAAEVYVRILALDPNNDAARLELAGLFYRARQYANCARTLKEYFNNQKNPPKDIQAIYLEALYKSKQYKEAFEVAKGYLKLEPNSILAHRAIAYGNLIDKQYAQSIEAYKKIATLDTMEFDDYRWLGTAYRQIKKDSMAAVTWEQALKDTTQPITLRSYLYGEVGSIWMNFKRYDRAAEFFQKRVLLDTTAVAASINLANCLIQLEEYEKAISALRKAVNRYPKYPPAYINLGICYYQMKDFDAGRKEFEMAIKVIDTAESKYRIDLADANRFIALALMLEKKSTPEASQKKWEDAIVYLRKSVKYKEDVGQAHLLLGQCFQNLNKKEDAIKEYKRTLQLEPKNEAAKKGLKDLQPE
ncbi:MAG: tetratricopeptide repeat protein [Bacteroidota bacterium]|jgi:tetratricopeptide (TPR) repeat protein